MCFDLNVGDFLVWPLFIYTYKQRLSFILYGKCINTKTMFFSCYSGVYSYLTLKIKSNGKQCVVIKWQNMV